MFHGLSPSQFGIALGNLSLASEQEIQAAWDLVHSPRAVLSVLPRELDEARDRIQLAAFQRGVTLSIP